MQAARENAKAVVHHTETRLARIHTRWGGSKCRDHLWDARKELRGDYVEQMKLCRVSCAEQPAQSTPSMGVRLGGAMVLGVLALLGLGATLMARSMIYALSSFVATWTPTVFSGHD
jgi:hypothetical protein